MRTRILASALLAALATTAGAQSPIKTSQLQIDTNKDATFETLTETQLTSLKAFILSGGGTLVIGSGSQSAPSLYPTGDSNTGIFAPSADAFSVTTGGTERWRWTSSYAESFEQLRADAFRGTVAGTESAPTFDFGSGGMTSGLFWNSGTEAIAFAIDENEVGSVDYNGIFAGTRYHSGNGSVSAAAFAPASDANTGFYFDGSGGTRLAGDGTLILSLATTGGSASFASSTSSGNTSIWTLAPSWTGASTTTRTIRGAYATPTLSSSGQSGTLTVRGSEVALTENSGLAGDGAGTSTHNITAEGLRVTVDQGLSARVESNPPAGAGTFTARGLYAAATGSTTGTTTATGAYVTASGADTNIGLHVAGGSTWLEAATSTTNALLFGSDARLYRSASATLRTDSALTVDGTLTASGNATVGDASTDEFTVADDDPTFSNVATGTVATFAAFNSSKHLLAVSDSTARTALGLGSLATASTINGSNWSGTDLSVVDGGTGASTFTSGYVLTGNGTSAITASASVGAFDTITTTFPASNFYGNLSDWSLGSASYASTASADAEMMIPIDVKPGDVISAYSVWWQGVAVDDDLASFQLKRRLITGTTNFNFSDVGDAPSAPTRTGNPQRSTHTISSPHTVEANYQYGIYIQAGGGVSSQFRVALVDVTRTKRAL